MKNLYEIIEQKVRIYVKGGKFTEIDLEDLERLKSAIDPNSTVTINAGYARAMDKNKKAFFIHRFVTDCPKGLVVDHLNHFRWDNKKENLKVCTQQENNRNRIHFNAAYEENKKVDKKRGILKMGGKKIQPLLTNQEVMEILNVNERTLYDYRENQGLPFFKLNQRTFRYDKELVLGWLKDREQNNG